MHVRLGLIPYPCSHILSYKDNSLWPNISPSQITIHLVASMIMLPILPENIFYQIRTGIEMHSLSLCLLAFRHHMSVYITDVHFNSFRWHCFGPLHQLCSRLRWQPTRESEVSSVRWWVCPALRVPLSWGRLTDADTQMFICLHVQH